MYNTKNKKIKKCIFWVIIIGIFFFIGYSVAKNVRAKETVKNEINDLSEKIKDALLRKYSRESSGIEVSSISYQINKIVKSKDYFNGGYRYEVICIWEVNISTSNWTEEGLRQSIYTDIEYSYTFDREYGYYKSTAGPIRIHDVDLTLVINGKTYTSSRDVKVENHKNQIQCKVCNKYFNQGTEDSKSILWKNMCTQCYKNYEATKDLLR